MNFTDLGFIFGFLPAVLILQELTFLRRYRIPILIVASLIFYMFSGFLHVAVLILNIISVYVFTASPRAKGSVWRLTAAIALPLASIFYFKYLDFLMRQIGLTPSPGLFKSEAALPAGISFFTFHMIAYAADRYFGKIEKAPSFSFFALFITFFPHLIAGPILRFHDVAQAISKLSLYRSLQSDRSIAIGYFCAGLALKILLADPLGNIIAPLKKTLVSLDWTGQLFIIFGYSFQIYFDFFGYSLMAMGLARWFGFIFPRNFDYPYESESPRAFWRRWHMTLSFWLRDYLYFPLGGNRAYIRNILIVFLVCGLWHGAGWNFLLWGALHAFLVLGYTAIAPMWNMMPKLIQQSLTFILISVGWLLFQFDLSGVIQFFQAPSLSGTQGVHDLWSWLLLAVAAIVCFGFKLEPYIESQSQGYLRDWLLTIIVAVLFVISVMLANQSNDFIYFRF